jgi:hypothetical protein
MFCVVDYYDYYYVWPCGYVVMCKFPKKIEFKSNYIRLFCL